MTWSKCHKNCVITGPLDAFCLVCESHLKSEDDLDAHYEKPIHKKNLESAQYFEKYMDDHIRKVKKGYYCEFCNLLLFTAAKVGLHIVETQHQYNRSTQLLRRVNNSVIAFNNILIDEKSWNGFVEDTCTICNTEFENENIHKTDQNHTLNLILKKIEFTEDKFVYRIIDESSYQCLTCNLVLASSTLSTHVEQPDHVKKLDVCRAFGTEMQDTNVITKTVKEQKTLKSTSKIDATLHKTELNDNKNKVTNKEHKTTAAKVEHKESKKSEGSSKKLSRDDAKNPAELEKYICNVLGAKNYVVVQERGRSMCLLCDWCMDTEVVAAHVRGRHHLTILKMHKERLDKMTRGDEEPKPKGDSHKANTDNKVNNDHKVNNENKANNDHKVNNDNKAKSDQKTKNDKSNTSDKTDDDKDKILDSLSEFQKNDININFEIGIASCKKCSKTLNLEFDVIQSHILEHKKTANKKETKPVQSADDVKNKSEPAKNSLYTKPVFMKRNEEGRSSRASSISSTMDDETEMYAKKHDLTYTDGKMYCTLCDSKLPTSLKSLKEHVLGAQHKKNKDTKNKPEALYKSPAFNKIPMQQFINSMVGVESDLIHDIIINEKYNINIMSFLMITSENFTLKCQPCEMVLRPDDLDTHKGTPNHIKALSETMVITSIDNEFVREPRPGVFHCGFCSSAVHGWDDLEEHLSAAEHRSRRTSAMWRLRENMAQVARERWQRAMGFMAFMNMFAGHDSSDDDWY